jgi:DNA polymerase III epsilon subunit-like protein
MSNNSDNKRKNDTDSVSIIDDSKKKQNSLMFRPSPDIIGNLHGPDKFIFDVETNGLDENSDVLSIAYYIVDNNNVILKTVSMYIKNRKNTEGAFHINNILDETLENDGICFYEVIKCFVEDLNTCNEIIGHNVSFDIFKMNENIKRHCIPVINEHGEKIEDIFKDKKITCTMRIYMRYIKPINIFKKKNKQELLKKGLGDMYINFFEKSFENAHTALADIGATFECYLKLISLTETV